jgi:molybdopterin-guanine dinucleotide biosynthesis protein B
MLLGVAGFSNQGKTELVIRIASELTANGYEVVTIKHAHEGDLLPAGKDTTRHLAAGAKFSIAVSSDGSVLYLQEGSLKSSLELANKVSSPDIILVEGFKGSSIPKIVLGNADAQGKIIARGESPDDVFDSAMAYIERGISIERALNKLPGLDCGGCGFENCRGLAEAMADGKVDITDCTKQHTGRTLIKVDGKILPLGSFVDEIVTNTILGMVSSLKGGESAGSVIIEIDTSRE